MATKLFLTIPLIAVLTLHVHVAKGFTLTPLSPARFGGAAGAASCSETTRCPAAAVIMTSTRRPVTFLSMAEESDERQAKRRNQQLVPHSCPGPGVM